MISKVRKHPKFNNYRPAECIKADVCNMIINGKEDEFFFDYCVWICVQHNCFPLYQTQVFFEEVLVFSTLCANTITQWDQSLYIVVFEFLLS